MVVDGIPPGEIISRLPDDSTLNVRNIREHLRRGHLPLDHETVREVIAAGRQGPITELVMDATVRVAADQHIAQLILARVFIAVANDEIEYTVRDGMRAARYLLDREKHEASVREHRRQVAAIEGSRAACVARVIEIAGEVGDELFMRALIARASNDPLVGPLLAG